TTQMVVASATGITATNTVLFIIDGTAANQEAVFVNSVSGTTVAVTRGYNGTKASRHLSGSVVMAGPPYAFYSIDPSGVPISGSCTSEPYTPYINILTGKQWLCSTITSSWVPGFFNTAIPPGVTTLVASVAGATN